MIYIQVGENSQVTFQHYFPFDEKLGMGKTKAELEAGGFFAESIPEPEVISGKSAVLKWSGTELFYEYVDILPTQEEEMAALKAELKATQEALDFLIMNGGL